MKKNILKLVLIPLLFLTGCGNNSADYIPTNKDQIGTYENETEVQNNVVYDTTLKIVYEVNYYIYGENVDQLISSIGNKNILLGGYFGNSKQTDSYATFIYRVPTENLDEFLDYIDANEGISSKTINTTDVTSTYSSLEANISVLTASRAAYIKMLEQENLELKDLITLQDKINEIDAQLLTYSNQKAKLDNKISYSTVTITYSKTTKYVEPSWFSEYFENLGSFFVGIGKFVLYFIPIGGTFAVIAVAIYLPIASYRRRRKQKNKEENK